MSENKEYFSHTDELGTIHISEEVLAGIAAAAAIEVEGVSSLATNFGSELAEFMNIKSVSKGVRILVEEGNVSVSVAVMVSYGFTIPQVAAAIQENVKNSVEAMSGLNVAAVDVTIAGIQFPQQK